jgi:hypothetical protein
LSIERESVFNFRTSERSTKILVDELEVCTPPFFYFFFLLPMIYMTNAEVILERFGSVVGGELVTFSGKNFNAVASLYTIIIDDEIYSVTNASTTSFSLITGKIPGLFEPSLVIPIAGTGNLAAQGLVFRYCNYWSHTVT